MPHNKQHDGVLLEEFKKGYTQALNILIRRHYSTFLKLSQELGFSDRDAETIFSNTFKGVSENITNYSYSLYNGTHWIYSYYFRSIDDFVKLHNGHASGSEVFNYINYPTSQQHQYKIAEVFGESLQAEELNNQEEQVLSVDTNIIQEYYGDLPIDNASIIRYKKTFYAMNSEILERSSYDILIRKSQQASSVMQRLQRGLIDRDMNDPVDTCRDDYMTAENGAITVPKGLHAGMKVMTLSGLARSGLVRSSIGTLSRYVKSGQINAYHFGRELLFDTSHVRAIQEIECTPTAAGKIRPIGYRYTDPTNRPRRPYSRTKAPHRGQHTA